MSARHKNNQTKQRIAYEAARLMTEAGVNDHEWARRKAAQKIGIHDRHLWPSAADIQDSLSQQQRLFQPDHEDTLRQLRIDALQAMRAFESFKPRLIGPVLDGSADPNSQISLYLYAESPDEVLLTLMEMHIPWEESERRLRFNGGVRKNLPAFRFIAGDNRIELIVLPWSSRSNPPLSPVTEKPDRGASIQQLQDLMNNQAANSY